MYVYPLPEYRLLFEPFRARKPQTNKVPSSACSCPASHSAQIEPCKSSNRSTTPKRKRVDSVSDVRRLDNPCARCAPQETEARSAQVPPACRFDGPAAHVTLDVAVPSPAAGRAQTLSPVSSRGRPISARVNAPRACAPIVADPMPCPAGTVQTSSRGIRSFPDAASSSAAPSPLRRNTSN